MLGTLDFTSSEHWAPFKQNWENPDEIGVVGQSVKLMLTK